MMRMFILNELVSTVNEVFFQRHKFLLTQFQFVTKTIRERCCEAMLRKTKLRKREKYKTMRKQKLAIVSRYTVRIQNKIFSYEQ